MGTHVHNPPRKTPGIRALRTRHPASVTIRGDAIEIRLGYRVHNFLLRADGFDRKQSRTPGSERASSVWSSDTTPAGSLRQLPPRPGLRLSTPPAPWR